MHSRLGAIGGITRIRLVVQRDGTHRADIWALSEKARQVLRQLRRVQTLFGWAARPHKPYSRRLQERSARGGLIPPPSRPVRDNPQVDTLRLATWNIGSARGKRSDLQLLAGQQRLDVICLQETQVAALDWPCRVPGYTTLEEPAVAGKPGHNGLAILVSKSLNARLSYAGPITPFMIVARLQWVSNGIVQTVLVGSVYIPPVGNVNRSLAIKSCRQCVLKVKDKFGAVPFFVGGDWNTLKKNLLKTLAVKQLTPVDIRGSEISRRQGKRGIDYFVDAGSIHDRPSGHVRLADSWVDRSWDASDHWPVIIHINWQAVVQAVKVRESEGWKIAGSERSYYRRLYTKLFDSGPAVTSAVSQDNQWAALGDQDSGDVADLDNKLRRFIKTSQDVAMGQAREEIRRPTSSHDPRRRKGRGVPKRLVRAIHKRQKSVGTMDYPAAAAKVRRLQRKFNRDQWAKSIKSGVQSFKQHSGSRGAWRWIQVIKDKGRGKARLGGTFRGLTPILSAESGELLTDTGEIANEWVAHFGRLAKDITGHSSDLNYWREKDWDKPPYSEPIDELNSDLTWSECKAAIRQMKSGKAPGEDGIPSEWFKLCVREEDRLMDEKQRRAAAAADPGADNPLTKMGNIVFDLIASLWDQAEDIPAWIKEATVCPIPKKGGKSEDPNNWRGISLISVILKVVSNVVIRRVRHQLEEHNLLAKEQAGFRDRLEGMAQVAALLECLQRRRIRGLKTWVCFVDIRKAYDTVPHGALFSKLERYGVTGKCLKFIMEIYKQSALTVNGSTNKCPLERGVRQGCPMSTTLFDIFINDVPEALQNPSKIPWGSLKDNLFLDIKGFLFADDLVILGDSQEDMKLSVNKMSEWAQENEMEFGISKCGIMVVNGSDADQTRAGKIRLQGQKLPVVTCYTYLGVTICRDLSMSQELTVRLEKTRRALYGIKDFLTDPWIPLGVRSLVYKTSVTSVAAFGSEIWGMKGDNSKSLQSLLNQGVRWLVGSKATSKGAVSIANAQLELKIPPLEAQAAARRARLYFKFHDYPKLWLSDLERCPLKSKERSWVAGTHEWLAKNSKQDLRSFEQAREGASTSDTATIHITPKSLARSVLRSKWTTINEAQVKAKVKSYKDYCKFGFSRTSYFINQYMTEPRLSKGVTQLVRARLGSSLTLKKLKQMHLVDNKDCPECRVEEDLAHVLVVCPRWSRFRSMHLGAPIDTVKTISESAQCQVALLLGGECNGVLFWKRHSTLRECEHFKLVAFFHAIWPRLRRLQLRWTPGTNAQGGVR